MLLAIERERRKAAGRNGRAGCLACLAPRPAGDIGKRSLKPTRGDGGDRPPQRVRVGVDGRLWVATLELPCATAAIRFRARTRWPKKLTINTSITT